jgi:hypothetical protein
VTSDEPRVVVETVRVRVIVRVPWRLRLRHWWLMRRLSRGLRELVREIDGEIERRFLGL